MLRAGKAKTKSNQIPKKSTRSSSGGIPAVNITTSAGGAAPAVNLTATLGAASSTTPSSPSTILPSTAGTPGGRTVLVGDQFQLLTDLKAEPIAKWAVKVKNLLTTGATNTALSMISDDRHRDLGQKIFSLIGDKDPAKARDWRN